MVQMLKGGNIVLFMTAAQYFIKYVMDHSI